MQPNKGLLLFDKCEISEVHNGSERYRVTADGLVGSSHGRVITKTLKMVLTAFLPGA